MGKRILVIGITDIGRRACAAFADAGAEITHLASPTDSELKELFLEPYDGVAVMLHNDIEALRYSMTIAHLNPGMPFLVAIFDRSVRHELERTIPNCITASPAFIAEASVIASLFVDCDAIRRVGPAENPSWEILEVADQQVSTSNYKPSLKTWITQLFAYGSGQLRAYDFASKALLSGLLSLTVILITDTLIIHRNLPLVESFYSAAAVIAGVTAPEQPHTQLQFIQSGIYMLLTIIFVAMFGAGVVNHILHGRRVGIVGRRVIPRRNHVVVVGLGQVGIRLCKELKLLKIPVVAIEQNENSRGILFARDMNVPVIVGNASDMRTLRRVNLSGAKALFAMTSSEDENVAIAVAARTKYPQTHISLRAGTNDAIEETQSLFAIGKVVDVNGLTASYAAQALLHQAPKVVFADGSALTIVTRDNQVISQPMAGRCSCS